MDILAMQVPKMRNPFVAAHVADVGPHGDASNDLPTHHSLRHILKCFLLLDLHEADLSGPVRMTVWVCQVLHSRSQCMLFTPFAGSKKFQSLNICMPSICSKESSPSCLRSIKGNKDCKIGADFKF